MRPSFCLVPLPLLAVPLLGQTASGSGVSAPAPLAVAQQPAAMRPLSWFDPSTGASLQDQDYSARAMFHQLHGQFLREEDRFRPALNFALFWQENAEVKGEPGEIELLRWKVDGSWRSPVDPDQFVIVEPRFQGSKYKFRGTQLNNADETLYDLELGLGFGKFFSEDLLVEAVLTPGVHSDLDGTLHHEDWRLFGRILATWRGQERLYWKLGVEASEVFKDVPVYPVLGLGWLFHEQWRLDAELPRRAELTWLASEATHVYASVRLDGDRYNIRQGFGNAERTYLVRTQELNAAVGLLHRINDRLSLFGEVGGTLGGKFDFEDVAGNAMYGTREGAVFVQFGFGIDF